MSIKETLTNLGKRTELHIEHPLPPEIEEGGLVEPWIEKEMQPNRPVDLNPYEANRVYHWEQRRRSRRVTNNGKR